jgi:hypothetical protein
MTVDYFTNTTAGEGTIGGLAAVVSTDAVGGPGLPASIPSDELFFWTRVWQQGEAESAAARDAGDVREFASGREAVRWLLSDD